MPCSQFSESRIGIPKIAPSHPPSFFTQTNKNISSFPLGLQQALARLEAEKRKKSAMAALFS